MYKMASARNQESKIENSEDDESGKNTTKRSVWKTDDPKVVELGVKHKRMVVAAIDFGTHGSGFALCSKADYLKDRNKIYAHTWNSGSTMTNKAPTTVLIDPNGKDYISFGYDAERMYLDMEPEEQRKHYLFRQFKMKLFNNQELSEKTLLKDITDKELPAVEVFAAVIRYFMEKLQTRSTTGSLYDFTYDDVYWVITVPAIWDLRAKQFMRKAAEKAGLKDSQLSLALEPEAASMYCRTVPVEICTQKDGAKQIASLQAGSKYLVIDLGGGTIDITAHEVLEDGGLKELHQANGGHYGGTCVNDEIMSFFKRLFGAPVMMKVKKNYPGDYLDLMNAIEMKKCSFKTDGGKITLRIPSTLLEAYETETDCKPESVLENTTFEGDVSIKLDKIHLSQTFFKTFFQPSVENVVKIIKDIIDLENMSDVDTLLVVGGYAESPLITHMLKTVFSQKRVVIPTDPSLSVLKGAVIYGFEPEIIASRVCRYTYGIAKRGIWKEGDPISKKLPEKTRKGLHWCDGVFDKHVEVGQVVKIGEFQACKEYTTEKGQEMALLDFYASKEKNPRFVDEPNCVRVGYFVLDLSGNKSEEKVLVSIGVGGTELEVKAMETKTEQVFKSLCNFLP